MSRCKRPHFIPCFLSAYWNEEYYEKKIKKEIIRKRSRKHKVYCLNIRADKILKNRKLEDIFYDKDLENLKLENFWTKLEKKDAYKIYENVIKKSDISTNYEKAMISDFLYQMICRNATFLKESLSKDNLDKENFIEEVKKITIISFISLEDRCEFMGYLTGLHWILYRTDRHVFPLADSFVCGKVKLPIFIALSPRLLLEITNNKSKGFILKKRGIGYSKLKEYQKHALKSSVREIIFSDESVLEEWKESEHYIKRREEMGYEK